MTVRHAGGIALIKDHSLDAMDTLGVSMDTYRVKYPAAVDPMVEQ